MKRSLLYALRNLRSAVLAGNAPSTGICEYIVNHPSAKYGLSYLQTMWTRWPRYSDDMYYPVPAINAEGEQLAYMHASYAFGCAVYDVEKMWGDNPYGNARRELLDWLIAELEQETQS